MPRPRISERELDVMQALWNLEREASVSDVHQAMSVSGELAYTTVQTMLNRLATKGQVKRRLDGRTYLYTPVTKEPVAARAALRSVVDRFFGGSAAELTAHLVDEVMSEAELRRVEKMLEERKKGRR
jgi:BlaI family transcriptional regulator, penicillinase repressor